MKTAFRKSFTRDLKKIKDNQLLQRVKQKIEEVEAADSLDDVTGASKISGHADYFRLRVGDYRLGIAVVQDEIAFVRCLHRREIYRFFP